MNELSIAWMPRCTSHSKVGCTYSPLGLITVLSNVLLTVVIFTLAIQLRCFTIFNTWSSNYLGPSRATFVEWCSPDRNSRQSLPQLDESRPDTHETLVPPVPQQRRRMKVLVKVSLIGPETLMVKTKLWGSAWSRKIILSSVEKWEITEFAILRTYPSSLGQR